ncbi:MAG: beta-glucuronidase [Bacteroidaceae bacterium]|nr:beta-glucuronidase [Bacteroidaceae bacterium]
MKIIKLTLLLTALSFMAYGAYGQVIDLSEQWRFQTDRGDTGIAEGWYGNHEFDDTILLPGSMPQRLKGDDISVDTKWVGSLYDSSYFYNPYMAKYRKPGKDMKLTFFLTPDKHYVGVAWYRRSVELTKQQLKGHRIHLYLERAHIETTLFVNGRRVGQENSLTTAHQYDVTDFLKKGQNDICIRIDNRLETVPVGQDSHSVTDQTQGDWNGIVGRMELRITPEVRFDDVQVFPDVDGGKAIVKMDVIGRLSKGATLMLDVSPVNGTDGVTRHVEKRMELPNDTNHLELSVPMGRFECWDEFNPYLYRLDAKVSASESHVTSVSFGMRKLEIKGRRFYLNGRQIQLRGTVENCDFPLTGYAPMDKEDWLRLFRRCRKFGLNHMRFHSYCPPEAAFAAADEVGFYLQPEGPSWPNHGVRLGYGEFIDHYLMNETMRMAKNYGNHPSFCMMACGNEPAGRWVEWVGKFVDYWKATDSRRVYTGASVGGGWAWQPKSQYHVKAGARGLNWNRQPQSMDDFTANITRYNGKDVPGGVDINEPFVSHETGQWCAFPDFDEVRKYTGVNKARNFEVFKDILYENGMGGLEKKFLMASGKLQALCYKYEIERTLRTPDYAGFQLLSINDYSGQGTALVGVTNVFFEDKGYMTAEDFREFCSPVVPLARMEKFTFTNAENFKAELMLNQFADHQLRNVTIVIDLKDGDDVLGSNERKYEEIGIGQNFPLGTTTYSLGIIKIPSKLTLQVRVLETINGKQVEVGRNHWDFWVYPKRVETPVGNVWVSDVLDDKSMEVLMKGGNVLLTAAGKITYGKDVVQQFTPVFWNTSWFKMRPPHTTGIYVENTHSIFELFPTDYHSDLQWWELVNRAQVMQFSEFPKDFQPLVQSIDTWFLSRKIGMLFEAKVGEGKVVMTTMDITKDLDNRIVARQMRASILKYMNSPKFKPKFDIAPELIRNLYTKEAPKVNMYTNGSPDELKPKLK